jgi:surface protein
MFDFFKKKQKMVVEQPKVIDEFEKYYSKNNLEYKSDNHKYDHLLYSGPCQPDNERINIQNIGKEYVTLEKGIDFCKHTPSTIENIVFTDVPYPRYFDAIDVSDEKNESVVAWVEDNTMIVSSGCKGVKINVNPNASYMFYARDKMRNIDFDNLRTVGCDNMNSMFDGCSELLTLDVSNFDTSQVVGMNRMFCLCNIAKDINVSSFDTTNVKDMTQMFGGCRFIKVLDLSHFKCNSLISGRGMFEGCDNLHTLNLGEFHFNPVPQELQNFMTKNDMPKDLFKDTPTLKNLISSDKDIIEQFENPDSGSLQNRKATKPYTQSKKIQKGKSHNDIEINM